MRLILYMFEYFVQLNFLHVLFMLLTVAAMQICSLIHLDGQTANSVGILLTPCTQFMKPFPFGIVLTTKDQALQKP